MFFSLTMEESVLARFFREDDAHFCFVLINLLTL
ncbi:hypothetical protein F383_29779 [Gossypium arboreum]|uniref:Uncharacterized protein n=1 Tax=Gossypium arboreum TaxID=29729 RepID=A0A0B0PDJ5_GOSAR|nr:hypothetical protein F383_29779 [Gossypium arboreum]